MINQAEEKIHRSIKALPYKIENGVFFFIPAEYARMGVTGEGTMRDFVKKNAPRLYESILAVMNPSFLQGMSVAKAVKRAFPGGHSDRIIIDIGSGTKNVENDIITLDHYPYEGVDVVADATHLPFIDASIDMVISVSLLEHISEPEKAIAEMVRVLKPGGYFYCAVPFMYPFHSAPSDYSRFTLKWFHHRLTGFTVVRSGVDAGPVTALTIFLSYFFGIVFSFGSRVWYSLLRDLFMAIFVPLRLLDLLISRLSFAEDSAASIYIFARKNETSDANRKMA